MVNQMQYGPWSDGQIFVILPHLKCSRPLYPASISELTPKLCWENCSHLEGMQLELLGVFSYHSQSQNISRNMQFGYLLA